MTERAGDDRLTRAEREASPHAVYRAYDAERCPLYYGSSISPFERLRTHAATKDGKRWVKNAAIIEIDWHPTRSAALLAEWEATTRDRPRYCVLGVTKRWPKPKPPKPPRDLRPIVMRAAYQFLEDQHRPPTEDDLILRVLTYLPWREANDWDIRPRIIQAVEALCNVPATQRGLCRPPNGRYILPDY